MKEMWNKSILPSHPLHLFRITKCKCDYRYANASVQNTPVSFFLALDYRTGIIHVGNYVTVIKIAKIFGENVQQEKRV